MMETRLIRVWRGVIALLCLLLSLTWSQAFAAETDAAPAATDAGPAIIFVAVMHLQLPAEPSPEQMQALGGHISHLKELYDAGVLLLAGPFDDDSGEGMSVFLAANLEEAQAICQSDPTVQSGLMQLVSLHPWFVPFNAWEGQSMTLEQFMQMMTAPPPAEESAGAAS